MNGLCQIKGKEKKPTCIFWGDYGWTGPEQPVVLPNYSILRNHKDTRLYNKIRKKEALEECSEILQPTLIKNEMKIEKKWKFENVIHF